MLEPGQTGADFSRFLRWIAGLDLLALGLAMTLVPQSFEAARFDPVRDQLALDGVILALAGLLLLALQLLRHQGARVLLVCRLVAATAFGLFLVRFWQIQSLAASSTYALLGAGLVFTAIRGVARPRFRARGDLFIWIAAARLLIYGLLIFIAPAEFRAPAAPSWMTSNLPLWGVAMLGCALALVVWQFRRRWPEGYLLPLIVAAISFLWAYGYALKGGFPATAITSMLFAAGVFIRPFVPRAWLRPPRRRLGTKLITASVLTVGVTLVVVVAVLLHQTEQAYRQRAELDLGATADVVAHDSASFVDGQIQLASLLARDPEVVDFEPASQLAFATRVIAGNPAVSLISISNDQGITVVRSTGEQPNIDRRGQIAAEQKVFETHQPDVGILFSPTQQVPVLVIREPIFGPADRFEGIYASQIRLSTLTKELIELPLGRSGRVIIVDQDGRVIAHPDAALVANQADLSGSPPVAAALAGRLVPSVFEDGGQRWLSVEARVPDLGWTVLVQRQESEVLAPANNARNEALWVLVVALFLATAGALWFSRSFSRPLTELARAARRLGEGEAAVMLPRADDDEVGDLVYAFDEMQERLAARTREREAAEAERGSLLVREQDARAEVEALLTATASLGVQAEPEEVLRTLVEQAAGLLEAEGALYAVLRDGRLVIPSRWIEGQWCEDGHEPRKGGILYSMWQSGRPFRSNDMAVAPQASRSIVQRYGIHSQLSVPIMAPDAVPLGLVSLHNTRRPVGFDERAERVLLAFCETGAAILLRAQDTAARLEAERSARRRNQEVEALLAAADQLNTATVELSELLPQVLRVAVECLDVRYAAIATNEDDHVVNRGVWSDGTWKPLDLHLPMDRSIAGWVIRHGRAYGGDESPPGSMHGSGDEQNRLEGKPLFAVPIAGRQGGVLGVLTLADPRDGQPFSDEDRRLAEGIAHHVAVALERSALIAELHSREERLRRQAVTDPLTGLGNRAMFLERLERALTNHRRPPRATAVLFLDLDGFKAVNDTQGHPAGDDLLRAAAERLLTCQRGDDSIARFGGDEFAVLLENVREPADAFLVAERILEEMRRPFLPDGREFVLSVSIGIALSTGGASRKSPEDLLREADIALYQAKARGKGQFALFNSTMNSAAVERLELEHELRQALDRREFRVHYQPVVDLRSGAIVGVEALLRWKHPRRGFLEPASFIPLLESTGLILPVGKWVLREACRQARDWQQRRGEARPLLMSVNVSAQQLERPDFVAQIAEAVADTGVLPGSLELEVTETTVMQHPESLPETVAALKQLGVRLAVDDFGTGYSSLEYVERLDPDRLKIDQTFIRKLNEDRSSGAIVQAVLTLARALDLDVTAEGIETAEQAEYLREAGCRYGQGFYFARPQPRRAMTLALEAERLQVG